jgi:hypothetical protein
MMVVRCILMDWKVHIVLQMGKAVEVYKPYSLRMVHNIHGRGVVATRLLDQEDDVPALFGLMGLVKLIRGYWTDGGL